MRFVQSDPMVIRACQIMKALGNEKRLKIVDVLIRGEATVSRIQAVTGFGQSTVSQHLSILRGEDIVVPRRAAQSVYYRLQSDVAADVLTALDNALCPQAGHRGENAQAFGNETDGATA